MTVETQNTCACPDCTCIVTVEGAIKKDEALFCSDTCAKGHPEGGTCGCGSCECTGTTH